MGFFKIYKKINYNDKDYIAVDFKYKNNKIPIILDEKYFDRKKFTMKLGLLYFHYNCNG